MLFKNLKSNLNKTQMECFKIHVGKTPCLMRVCLSSTKYSVQDFRM